MSRLLLLLTLVTAGCAPPRTALVAATPDQAEARLLTYLLTEEHSGGLMAQHSLSVSPPFALVEDSSTFGPAKTRFWELRRAQLGGGIDGLFWINAATGHVHQIFPVRPDHTLQELPH